MTSNIAEVLKLAAKPIQHDNDDADLAGVPFQAGELPHPCEREVRGASPTRRVSTGGEPSRRRRRSCCDNSNAESHAVRLAGDTDHGTKLETGANSAEPKTGSKRGGSWRRKTRRRPRVGDPRCWKPCCSLRMGDAPANLEKMWKSWEHQVDVYENLSASKAG